jgi:deazaflavin-dependent oxidoreductase (nitroreductase family)
MAATVRNRALIRFMSKLHVLLYRLTGGFLGGRVSGLPVLLLTHKGRKTGALYTTPLMHLRDGERYVVIASNAGAAKDPLWWSNLEADPDARVQVRRQIVPVKARPAGGEERARLWEAAKQAWSGYAEYEKATTRQIPVVILEPSA